MNLDLNIVVSSSLNKKLGVAAYKKVISEATERQVHSSASKTARYAPRKTGALANSFPASITKIGPTMWTYGSELHYANIQELTNRTKAGFTRKTVQEDRPAYIASIESGIKGVSK